MVIRPRCRAETVANLQDRTGKLRSRICKGESPAGRSRICKGWKEKGSLRQWVERLGQGVPHGDPRGGRLKGDGGHELLAIGFRCA